MTLIPSPHGEPEPDIAPGLPTRVDPENDPVNEVAVTDPVTTTFPLEMIPFLATNSKLIFFASSLSEV